MTLILDAFRWLTDPANWVGTSGIPLRLAQHLLISLLAVLLSAAIALPLGVAIGHSRRGSGLVGAVTGAARAVPTLGLLTLFGLGLGIGIKAPLLALIVLAIPSLLAGAYSGIQAIDPTIPLAASAIGMSRPQIIRKVEIPLALPVIVGGLRAATLQVIATATLAAYTANVGLGRYLFAGLKTRQYGQMLGAALLVTMLAILAEGVLAAWQRHATMQAAPMSTGRKAE